jgi:hypothetical protein
MVLPGSLKFWTSFFFCHVLMIFFFKCLFSNSSKPIRRGGKQTTCGQGSRANDCGQSFDKASRAGKACPCNTATRPLHHRLLLQRMPARLQHRNRHGPAPAPGASFAARAVDRRPPAQDHRKHKAEEDAAGVDVVLVHPLESSYTPGDSGV